MFLLDTMVVSETGKRASHPHVAAWLAAVDTATLLISVITLGEISAGIMRSRAADPLFSGRLPQWSQRIRRQFDQRTLAISTTVALRWGELHARLKRRDLDLLIAATALEHDLTVVTRNVRHFEPTGARLLNPYEPA